MIIVYTWYTCNHLIHKVTVHHGPVDVFGLYFLSVGL